jgi:hypothetical protein
VTDVLSGSQGGVHYEGFLQLVRVASSPVRKAVMTHKYRGSQQSSREVKPKFIDSTQGEPKNIYKP